MDHSTKKMLEQRAQEIRYNTIDAIGTLGVGHVGGCLSIADLLAVLYYDKMNIEPTNPKMPGRDRLVISKGHAGPALYATLAAKGFFPMDWLKTLNQPETNLPSHCDMNRTPGVDMTAGSLGQGISCAIGIAQGSKIAKDNATIYCIIGDGESQEGQVWEASMTAAQYKLDNFILFLDYNKKQIDGMVADVNDLINPCAKWAAFGFNTWEIDGHDVVAIADAIEDAKTIKNGKPCFICLNTIKGKGVSYIEAAGFGNHNMTISPEEKEIALNELK